VLGRDHPSRRPSSSELRQVSELILAEDYKSSTDNSAGMTEVMGALEAGGCPMLTKLSFSCCEGVGGGAEDRGGAGAAQG
jgi:hypothetical protein